MMHRPDEQCCSNCQFVTTIPAAEGKEFDPSNIICRRYHPHGAPMRRKLEITDWCGEWQRSLGVALPS